MVVMYIGGSLVCAKCVCAALAHDFERYASMSLFTVYCVLLAVCMAVINTSYDLCCLLVMH
jgi:hypothetical protein